MIRKLLFLLVCAVVALAIFGVFGPAVRLALLKLLGRVAIPVLILIVGASAAGWVRDRVVAYRARRGAGRQ